MRIFLFIPILFSSLLLSLPSAAQTSWSDSLTTLQQQISRNPHNIILRLNKAAVNIQLGQWQYAAEEYGRVLEKAPDNLTAHFFRAYAYVQLRMLPLAAADYESVLSRVPTHFEARLGLAEVRREMGRKTETLDQLNLLVQQHPDSAMAWAVRAQYEEQLAAADKDKRKAGGWIDAAEYDWQEAVRLAPQRRDFAAALNRLRSKRQGTH